MTTRRHPRMTSSIANAFGGPRLAARLLSSIILAGSLLPASGRAAAAAAPSTAPAAAPAGAPLAFPNPTSPRSLTEVN